MNPPPQPPPVPVSDSKVHGLADHHFRHESGRLVAILTGQFGAHRLQMAEDCVQDALIRALKTWPFSGVPDNPAAWLMRTAKNLAMDQLRREQNFQQKLPDIVTTMEPPAPGSPAPPEDESGIHDDQLRLIFVCCHPALPPEAQTALALKTLCGFSPAEIAKAFLISEAAVAKRLTRARQRIHAERIPFEIPAELELPQRLDTVLKILYLLFNEGYKASHGEEIVRADLCDEAIRLATLLAAHPAGDQSSTHALLALMLLTAARFPARSDSLGNLLRLADQDRTLWDASRIRAGLYHLAQSTQGDQLSEYHLQAGIAACHTFAPSDEETDWPCILKLYDHLAARHPSPVITLNRAVAVAKVHGIQSAIESLELGPDRERLANHHLYHAVLGDLQTQNGNPSAAARHFRKALDLAETKPERTHLAKRLEDCLSGNGGDEWS